MKARGRVQRQVAGGFQWRCIVSASILSLSFCFLVGILLAIALSITALPETFIPALGMVISMVSMFIGGAIAARKSQVSGWLHGGMAGVAVVVLLWVLGSLGWGIPTTTLSLVKGLGYGFAIGVVGGVFGVNA